MPNDPIKPALLYLIARSYEEMKNYSLARRYYRRVMTLEPITSVAHKSAKYRETYSYLMEGDVDAVLSYTENSEDPYFLIMRGYGYLQSLEWESARATFISAEEKFKDINSRELLKEVIKKLKSNNYVVGNIDATIICEHPKMQSYIHQMKENISDDCMCDITDINIKATTTEQLGFIGRSEGIAAQAICLIKEV